MNFKNFKLMWRAFWWGIFHPFASEARRDEYAKDLVDAKWLDYNRED